MINIEFAVDMIQCINSRIYTNQLNEIIQANNNSSVQPGFYIKSEDDKVMNLCCDIQDVLNKYSDNNIETKA